MDLTRGDFPESRIGVPIVTSTAASTGDAVAGGAILFTGDEWRRWFLFEKSAAKQTDTNTLQVLIRAVGSVTAGVVIHIDQLSPGQVIGATAFRAVGKVRDPERHANVGLRVERLVLIKSAFALSTKALAEICRVSRAALYNWLSQDETQHLSPANWKRLSDLAAFAEEWNRLSRAPVGQLLNEPLKSGTTLMSLLCALQLNQRAIHNALTYLAEMVATKPPRRDAKLRQSGVKPRPLIGQLMRDD